jgi:hypothetical protein
LSFALIIIARSLGTLLLGAVMMLIDIFLFITRYDADLLTVFRLR